VTLDFGALLQVLADGRVDFIVIGGVAASAHGSARFTGDLDVAYSRTKDNIDRLIAALAPVHPYLRGAPPGLPFRFDRPTIQHGLNFTLTTDLGDFDALGEVAGGGTYEQLLAHTVELELYGVRCRVLNLDTLITTKRAAGRPRDFEAIAELEILRDVERKGKTRSPEPPG
jgi:hypothetical protein